MVHCPRTQAHSFASTSAGAQASHTPLVRSPVHKVEGRPQSVWAVRAQQQQSVRQKTGAEHAQRRDSGLGDVLGPIGLTLGGQLKPEAAGAPPEELANGHTEPAQSIHSLTTEEWRRRYETDGYVDLWVEEEFNSGSRVAGGRDAYKGGAAGAGSGEGPGTSAAPRHRVKIFNRAAGQEVEVDVPEDRYILWEAEEHGLLLPYACRMGCCTACAVRVLQGDLYQPQSLGVSRELREAGYALMCVGFPRSDLVLETVDEDEVYDLQFGRSFAEQAVDPRNQSVERDDFALEIANMDE